MARESLMLAPVTAATRRLSNGEQQIFEEAKLISKSWSNLGIKIFLTTPTVTEIFSIYIINRRFVNYMDIFIYIQIQNVY